MKHSKIILAFLILSILNGCASGYKTISPPTLNYNSKSTDKQVAFEYKYDLLNKKYGKKEIKNGVRLVAVKITNNSGKDLVFDQDIKLTYSNDNQIAIMDNAKVFDSLKQITPYYLFYLLLTPMNLYTYSNSSTGQQQQTSSTPIGLVVGPGLALGNIIAASAANSNLKEELRKYNIEGTTIKNGTTAYGLIGIRANNFDALKIKIQEVIANHNNL